MSKTVFLTFGGPSRNYHDAVKRICNEALQFNIFDSIIGLTDLHLKNHANFYTRHKQFMETNPRGYGYWIWKPYIVQQQLASMNENDILVYADAGCVMNINGVRRMHEYFEMVNNSEYGILSFQLEHSEKTWSKMDLIEYLGVHEHSNTNQCISGVFIIRKCKHTTDLVNKWYETCCNYDLISDTPSVSKNDDSFIEHRHDQSVLSLLLKKHGSIIIDDETYFVNWNDGIDSPILAMRMRG